MAEVKVLRLAKAGATYNVSTEHIIEALNKAKFELDSNPNFKLTPEMIAVLDKEFGADKAIKQQAEISKPVEKPKKEEAEITVVAKTVAPLKKEEEPEVVEQELLVKNNLAPKPEVSDLITAEKVTLEGPNIIGKIDLDKPKKTTKKTTKDEVVEEKPVEKPIEKPATKKTKTEGAPIAEVAPPTVEEVTPKKEEVKEAPVEVRHETVYQKLDGPKILGKIEIKAEPSRKREDAEGEKKKRERKLIKKQARPANTTGTTTPGLYDKKVDNFQRKRELNRPATITGTPQEITEKQIEDKIKATMAKIQGQTSKSGRVKRGRDKRSAFKENAQAEEENKLNAKLKVTEFMTVSELASLMNISPVKVISTCMTLGVMVSINQRLDAEILELVAAENGFEVEFQSAEETTAFKEDEEENPDSLIPRAPIVTIMGHVDHGKTSLLDYIRKTNVADKEAGGITQHIGAYEVTTASGKKITFLDTPGHEAFTAMRARGAKVTDVAVIVIAADDAVMPQTKEAINHAQSAGVPMIFAFNKIDKPGANSDKIREQLSAMNLLVEEWGGKFQTQEISAKTGLNVDALLDKITIESDMLDLKANPNKEAFGSVIEATLDKGRGYTTTLLVQSGTLHLGDYIVSGPFSGKIKAMFDHKGTRQQVAGPSTPVQILGLNGAPQSGEKFKIFKDEQAAKELANKRAQLERETGIRTKKHITLDEIGRRLALGNFKELNLIIKGDVDGSVEALADSLLKLSTDEIAVKVVHKGVGQISESDVMLATASDAILIGFNVRPSQNAKKIAEEENIEIKLYSIIYNAIADVKNAMEGMLEPKIEEKVIGMLEVREVYNITKVGTIAGSFVKEGRILNKSKVRIIRDGIVLHTGAVSALKRFKDDVKEVVSGLDCGVQIKDYQDIKPNDTIEVFEEIEVVRKL